MEEEEVGVLPLEEEEVGDLLWEEEEVGDLPWEEGVGVELLLLEEAGVQLRGLTGRWRRWGRAGPRPLCCASGTRPSGHRPWT